MGAYSAQPPPAVAVAIALNAPYYKELGSPYNKALDAPNHNTLMPLMKSPLMLSLMTSPWMPLLTNAGGDVLELEILGHNIYSIGTAPSQHHTGAAVSFPITLRTTKSCSLVMFTFYYTCPILAQYWSSPTIEECRAASKFTCRSTFLYGWTGPI